MRGLDDTDRAIIDLLAADARRPFSEIGEEVGLSGPAVSDRVDRLREMGVIEGFTVSLDRSVLGGGRPVLVDIEAEPGRSEAVAEALRARDTVEQVVRTADDRVVATATLRASVADLLGDAFDAVAGYEVDLVADATESAGVGQRAFAPDCAECGNTVDAEGESRTLDGDDYYFCCGSCASRFVERYESLKEDV